MQAKAFVILYALHVLGSSRQNCCNLLSELAFGFVVVDSVTGNSRELPASVVLIMDVICDILEVLHVGSDTKVNEYIFIHRLYKAMLKV